ncbi:MAG: STAS domain-containing protein [Planctomycetota bacterium]
MADFEIEHESREDVRVLRLKGQLDAHTFPALQEQLEGLDEADPPRVVLDCSGLEYVSSAGLGVLKKMSRDFRQRDGDLRLASLTEKIANVMSLLGFNQVIRVFGDLDEAVRSYKGK